ncbi:D-2-hydroxyacid dehydrogenase [Desulfocurvus sp. DL9XJH121]
MDRPRIVVMDGFNLNPGDNPWDEVAALGELTVHQRTAASEVLERATGADVVLTNKVVIPGDVIKALPDLKFVSLLSTGYDRVDIRVAAERGIPVCNVPAYSTTTVAQFAFALILGLNHRVADHDRGLREGLWHKGGLNWGFWNAPQVELAGQTMGVVGFGDIGSRVAELAHAFGMRVLAYAPRPKPAPWYKPFGFVSLEELFEQSDVVSLHCPLTADNAGFVNASLIDRMKSDAIIVNTARGALINEDDLLAALTAKRIRGAGLDVVAKEPMVADHPFLKLDNCLLTPHMAWGSLAARQRLMHQTAENIKAWMAGAPVNVVNGL